MTRPAAAFGPLRLVALAPLWLASAGPPDAAAQAANGPDSLPAAAAAAPASAGQRLASTGRALLSDLGYAASSPARMNRGGALWAAGILATGAVVFAYDREIQQAFLRSRGNHLYDAWLETGETLESAGHMGRTGAYWVAAALVGTVFEIRPVQALTLDVIESHLISGGIRNTAKLIVGRERPFEAGPRSFFKGGTSLPSGHASVVFEVATILSHHVRETPRALRVPVTVVAYGLATSVAMQRVDSRGHWPSDVFLAAASGTVIARTVAQRNASRRMAIMPRLGTAGGPSGVVLSWRL